MLSLTFDSTAGMHFALPRTRDLPSCKIGLRLITSDSRTGYGGGERRTYSSTTGQYGGSSMGG
jgi:hypothetical protein